MNRKAIASIIFGLLIIVTLVQAIQLTSLKAKISDNSFTSVSTQTSSARTTPSSHSPASGNAKLPSSLKDLPTMVGGC
jgi:hypothetical protein